MLGVIYDEENLNPNSLVHWIYILIPEQYQRLSLLKEAVVLKEHRLLFNILMTWKKAERRIFMESSADQVIIVINTWHYTSETFLI